MKNVLFICNTHYQLIVAIQMRLTLMKENAASVLITDRSKGAKQISARLRDTAIFDQVFFQEVREPKGRRASLIERLSLIKQGVFGTRLYKTSKHIVFDEIIGFNFDLHSHAVFANEYKKNKHITCEKMEEGLLSYATKEDSSGVLSAIYKIRRLLHRKNMRHLPTRFYCFQPIAYPGKLAATPIPKLTFSDEKIKSILTDVFIGTRQIFNKYDEKYILLPCIYDKEGGEPIGELSLAIRLAEKVGKNNLLVKVHPRDDADRYREAGLRVDAESAVPWEVIQINHDFSDKVLLSTLSTSLLSTCSLFEVPPRSFYLYPLCDLSSNPLAKHYKGVVEDYISKADVLALKNLDVCSSLNSLPKT